MTHDKDNKARCKKCFLVVKMTNSICVNRKLLRMKSTKKQENNRTLERTVFSLICSGPSPGGLQHMQAASNAVEAIRSIFLKEQGFYAKGPQWLKLDCTEMIVPRLKFEICKVLEVCLIFVGFNHLNHCNRCPKIFTSPFSHSTVSVLLTGVQGCSASNLNAHVQSCTSFE